jgi:uncharacterized damage-inducible protein DinB
MFLTIKQFTDAWQQESGNTRKILSALTDDSLDIKVADQYRSIGRMAWHIVLTLGDMGEGVGLKVDAPAKDAPVPPSAREIQDAYNKAAKTLSDSVISDWTDHTLGTEVEMFGQKFTNGFGLWMTLVHEIHHRAQMTVLMRQAGLKVPGIYGPSYEEWAAFGAEPPSI